MGDHSESTPVVMSPPACLLKPLKVPEALLMGPGPSNAAPRILAAGNKPVTSHMYKYLWQIMDEVKEGLKYLFQTKNEVTLSISGTGTSAMEASCCNMVEPDETVLVCVNGLWGARWAEMAERARGDVRILEKPLGEIFNEEEIKMALEEHKPSVMFITHGESTSGTCQPLQGIGDLCHRYGTYLVVDSVAALGAVPMYMDQWGIDVLYTGSQKVLACPAGAAPISFSPSAWSKIKNRATKVQSFYFDMTLLANCWGCDDKPRKYHHTIMSNTIYNLRESLAMIAEETLEVVWERHRKMSEMLWDGLEKMGLTFFVEDPSKRLPIVTTVKFPMGLDWVAVKDYVIEQYGIEIAGGLGPSVGKVWRIGVMGHNANSDNVTRVLTALEEGIKHVQPEVNGSM